MSRAKRPSGTVIAAVAVAAVLVPTAATAAGSLVNIGDPYTSAKARVSAGRLNVDAGATTLAFRTKPGAESFPAGTTKFLGKVDTAGYSKIRIIATERAGSASNITFRVTATEGNELVSQLATFTLTPQSSRTMVIDVPARAVSIYAAAAPGSGNVATDFLVYGAR